MRNFSYDKELIKELRKDKIDYQIFHLKEIFGIEYIKDSL